MLRKYARYFQQKYRLTDYQMKQLRYLLCTLLSETSKFLLLYFLFRRRTGLFLFATLLLGLLRTVSGGLHFQTYPGCLLFSILFYTLALQILPPYLPARLWQLITLFFCLLVNYKVGAVVSDKRPTPGYRRLSRCKKNGFLLIFIFLLAVYILPQNTYLNTGFWIVLLHTLQLLWAKIRQKGGFRHALQTTAMYSLMARRFSLFRHKLAAIWRMLLS